MSLTKDLFMRETTPQGFTSHTPAQQPSSGVARQGAGATPSPQSPEEDGKQETKRLSGRLPSSSNPSGGLMFERTRRVKDMVKEIYELYPSTRGDDRLMIKRVLDRNFPQVKLTPIMFEALRSIPSFESMRRRGQELRIEHPELQPTERTQKKRARRASAFRNYYGCGRLKITDWM